MKKKMFNVTELLSVKTIGVFKMNRDDLMHLKIQAAMREHNIPESDY